MANVMTEISEWVKDLPFWEQAALQRILAGEEFTPEFDKQLLKWLLEDKQLSKTDSARPVVDFSRFMSASAGAASRKPKLLGIENATNVNALAGNQSLRFDPIGAPHGSHPAKSDAANRAAMPAPRMLESV